MKPSMINFGTEGDEQRGSVRPIKRHYIRIKLSIYLAVIVVALFAGCTEPDHVTVTARPDPNTSSSGTLGSVKATNGVLPLSETDRPVPHDTIVRKDTVIRQR